MVPINRRILGMNRMIQPARCPAVELNTGMRTIRTVPPRNRLVVHFINTVTFAARDFSARRGASDEHTLQGSVRSEQRSLAEKELPPEGLRRIWPEAALLVGYRPTAGYAPSSRLAPGQIGRNERHRIYAHDHLVPHF